MKLRAIPYILIMLMPVVCTAQQNSRLEGCVDPKVITTLLSKLHQNNSQVMSEEQVRAGWPIELADVEDASRTSRTLQSNDRILRGHIQCSEDFTFSLRQEGSATLMELHGATVNYLARRRSVLATMAKLFAQTVGLGAADLKTVGRESSQSFQWEAYKGSERRAYLIDLRFTREAGLWKMFFDTAFYAVKP